MMVYNRSEASLKQSKLLSSVTLFQHFYYYCYYYYCYYHRGQELAPRVLQQPEMEHQEAEARREGWPHAEV